MTRSRLCRCLLGLILFATLPAEGGGPTPASWVRANVAKLVPIYRDLHQNPELSYQEARTGKLLAREWRAAGLEVLSEIGGHGVVGVMKNGPGAVLMLRTDMDALPVSESTGVSYASRVKVKNEEGADVGVMHACGHDIHLTNLIGVARYLNTNRDQWSGTVLFVGQPAEERGGGALALLHDGLFEKFPKPEAALALHVDSDLAAGKVSYHSGFTMASADSVDVILKGRGGHGAMPQLTVDPVVMAAQYVLSLQTLISRESNPLEPGVVTVGALHCGTKHNLISDTCHLQLSVRSASAAARERLIDGIRRKAEAVAAGAGAPVPEVRVGHETTPALFNDPSLVARVLPSLQHALGKQNVVPGEAAMVSEDFSRYAEAGVPVFMFRLGSVEAGRLKDLRKESGQAPSLHSALYYPDPEPTLVAGVTAMSQAVIEYLAKTSVSKRAE